MKFLKTPMVDINGKYLHILIFVVFYITNHIHVIYVHVSSKDACLLPLVVQPNGHFFSGVTREQ